MSTEINTGPTATLQESSIRNWLIGGTLFVAAAIVFGLLYLFVIAPSIPSGNVGWFLFSFATGLTMIIMPCTLPLAFVIVPLSMGKGLVRGLGMAVAFGLGIALTLSLYGVAAALLGGVAIDALGADLESIKNWVYFVAGTFAFLFALSEIGLLNVHMPTYTGAAPAFIQKRQEVLKAFFLGVFLGNVGVGCPHPATPLILIEIASSGDVFYGWLMFLIHAIGRILPLLLLAFLAILGVNGLNWLMARKSTLERVTGWAMVFVAGFILTLGLFSHDWWVNSGIHSALETLTQESKFNTLINDTLGTNVAHLHGLETGEGLFGLPLAWGSVFLVLVWLIPIWWWYFRKKNLMKNSPAFKIQALEAQIDRLERDRRQIESMFSIDEIETTFDLKHTQEEIDALENKRREEEAKVQFGETGVMKDPLARTYEARILGIERNYLIAVSVFLILIFVHYLPTNFYYKNVGGGGDHHSTAPSMDHGDTGTGDHDHGSTPSSQPAKAGATPYNTSIDGLEEASPLNFVELKDGDTYSIEASYVKKKIGNQWYRMMAYNGSIPGPFIKVLESSTVTIVFTNNTDIDQTIHSHGVRIDNNYDGVPGITQNVVKPGEVFTYKVNFNEPSLAWYHPHTRDDYAQELGMYGTYQIDSKDPSYLPSVDQELPLVIDDILIENNVIASFYKEFTNHALLGRLGNTYLINGDNDYYKEVKQGEVVRLLLTNASNARTYRLSLPGASMKRVAGELSRYENEEFVDEIVLSPAERMIVDVQFNTPGRVELVNRMKSATHVLGQFRVLDEAIASESTETFNTARRNTTVKSEMDALRTRYSNTAPDKKLRLTVNIKGSVDHSTHAHGSGMSGMSAMGDHNQMGMMHNASLENIEWGEEATMDHTNTSENVEWMLIDEATGLSNMSIPVKDWTFKQGSFVKIRITNDHMAAHVMQHPIHLHGQRFVVLNENGVANTNMAWKDTALVLPGGYIDILVDMSNLGEWMLHCHIVEHLFAGMMMPFRVEDQNGYATGDEFRRANQGTETVKPNITPTTAYTFETPTSESYRVQADKQMVVVGEDELIELSFQDSEGNAVNLSDQEKPALQIHFVNSTNDVSFTTYPGNTVLPEPSKVPVMTPKQDDGHNHIHFLGTNVAYAHGEVVNDGHHAGNVARTYTVPVRFPKIGLYKGFVEFYLEGEATPRVAIINIDVVDSSWSIDNYGWSKNTKWWVLLIISLMLMIPLSLFVRKYISNDTSKTQK